MGLVDPVMRSRMFYTWQHRPEAAIRWFDLPFRWAMPWDQEPVHANIATDGPKTLSFYMYRAGGEFAYPLENVNAGSLEGVMWYLHNEVVASAPRKYGIDRIRRYRVQVHNTQELFNVHKKQFGPYFAFDAGRCTTAGINCAKAYRQYGFVVGCQPIPAQSFKYLSLQQTVASCEPGSEKCRAGIWYSLPGECPSKGIPQESINANEADQNVIQYKNLDCRLRMPGGRCDRATGAPDCTYSVEDAGEVFLDELAGIVDYNFWWNTSFDQCMREKQAGVRVAPCEKHLEYILELDRGVGTDFWDARGDASRCRGRVDKALNMFAQKYPTMDVRLDAPICDFDMYYKDEFSWPQNHDGARPSEFWSYSQGGTVPQAYREKFATPPPKAMYQPGPDSVH